MRLCFKGSWDSCLCSPTQTCEGGYRRCTQTVFGHECRFDHTNQAAVRWQSVVDTETILVPLRRAYCCLHAGHCTCITAVPELLQIPTSAQAQTLTPPSLLLSYKPPGSATWQMLTGHRTGHMKLWQTSHQERFQPLAVIRTARNSPVQSLVILPSLHLVCVGHLDGCIGLYITPNPGSPRQCIPACQIDGGLPALTMPSAVFEAHRSGLQQCVAGDTGLVSLGAFGSIMVWPRAELQGTLSKAGLLASARYCFCHTLDSTTDYSVSHAHAQSGLIGTPTLLSGALMLLSLSSQLSRPSESLRACYRLLAYHRA